MRSRIYNFSSGPAALPLPVLEQVQRELVELPGLGMSVLEASHRSKVVDEIINAAEGDLRRLAGIPENYRVLFLHGGASLQFAMVPMNLLRQGASADYLVTGHWARRALHEAEKVGAVRVAATSEPDRFNYIPGPDDIRVARDAAYVHMTSNNTIVGTQWRNLPDVGDRPLVSDSSSDVLSCPVDISRYAVVYASAQKNLGPAGLAVVIIREDMARRSSGALPAMMSYRVHVENGSRYNTPPVFAIYVLRLVMAWLIENGGLETMAAHNERKAARVYAEIDRTGFYRGTARKDSRSVMNVTFRLLEEGLEASFVKEAAAGGLEGLKGHRSVGGLRASMYNAFPEAGADALVSFMRDFERRYG